MDLLSEYENAEANQDQKTPNLPTSSAVATNQFERGLQATDQVNTALREVAQKDSNHVAIDLNDSVLKDQEDSALPQVIQASSDLPVNDQVVQDSLENEAGS